MDCLLGADCSWGGLAVSTALGAGFGALGGPLDVAERAAAAGDATADAAEGGAGVCPAGGLSFAASTPVATLSGERAIGSLKVGDQVTAYDPTTGTTSTHTVQHVWINHDSDLLDVTLHTPDTTHSTAATSDAKQREVALRAHGLRARLMTRPISRTVARRQRRQERHRTRPSTLPPTIPG